MDILTAQTNNLVAKAIGRRVIADGGIAIRIQCKAYPASSKHYADAVLVSATSLVLSIDGVADTTFAGGSGTLLFATYTNLGLLVDQINTSSNWQAEIVAGLRSDAINGSELLARTTSTFKMFTEVDLYFDSSDNGVLGISFLLEPDLVFETADKVQAEHRVGVKRILWRSNTSGGEAVTLAVYELKKDKVFFLRTLLAGTAADDVEGDTGATWNVIAHADWGNSILIRITSTGWVDLAAYLQVYGVRE